MTSEHFSVAFDGPAVADRTLDAAEFGTAMLAFAELVHTTQDVLAPGGPRYRVRVREITTGSFEVGLELHQWIDAAAAFLVSDGMAGLAVLKTLFGGPGLFEFFRWCRGKRPDSIVETANGTIVEIDSKQRTFALGVGRLSVRRDIRRNVARIVGPLREGEIESLDVAVPREARLHLTPTDRPALTAPLDDEPAVDSTTDLRLTIETVRFRSRKWESGNPLTKNLFWASIEDEDFLADVRKRQEGFFRGDALYCTPRVQQWELAQTEYQTDYSIIRVREHRPSGEGSQTSIE